MSYNPDDLLDRGGERNPFQNRLSVNDPERDKLGSEGFRKLVIYREILVICVKVVIFKMTK